jgi:hypothetical protein
MCNKYGIEENLAGFFQKSITFCLLIFALIMGMFAFSKGG